MKPSSGHVAVEKAENSLKICRKLQLASKTRIALKKYQKADRKGQELSNSCTLAKDSE
jgi:hypothetical protein